MARARRRRPRQQRNRLGQYMRVTQPPPRARVRSVSTVPPQAWRLGPRYRDPRPGPTFGQFMTRTARGMAEVQINTEEFAAALQHFHDLVRGNIDDLVTAHALDAQARIQMRTPVATGRARNSWHTIPPNRNDASFTYQDNQGRSYRGSAGIRTGPGQAIVATNVVYMAKLEAGSSRQAPQGMVAVTMKEKTGELERAITQRVQSLWDSL